MIVFSISNNETHTDKCINLLFNGMKREGTLKGGWGLTRLEARDSCMGFKPVTRLDPPNPLACSACEATVALKIVAALRASFHLDATMLSLMFTNSCWGWQRIHGIANDYRSRIRAEFGSKFVGESTFLSRRSQSHLSFILRRFRGLSFIPWRSPSSADGPRNHISLGSGLLFPAN